MATVRAGKTFRYILRYLIDPDFAPKRRIAELIDFCRASHIEEVMMFIAAEELSAGHPTDAELDAYIALGITLRSELAEAGIDLSLNPWSTTHHTGRGRHLRPGQDFRLMVGESGIPSTVTACPLCENWRAYLTAAFARMAGEIKPTVLWIEDDWRLKNHDAPLGWGGCFCEEHLRQFSQRVGQEVSRAELLETILAAGLPHPWRETWLDLSRETMLVPLHRLAEAVQKSAPDTRLALMSSNPDAHAAEGRDWPRFQDAIRGGQPFISRPNMGPYTQSHALQSPPSATRLTIANLHGDIEVYPELENSPRCGPYSKSRAYSVFQILHSAAMGADGITINHYDMLGNGISLDPAFGQGLAAAKARLNAVFELGLDDRKAQGVRILFRPEISRHIDARKSGAGMGSLSQNSRAWADACSILGIAHFFSAKLGAERGPVMVNEQTIRALSGEEIRTLLRGDVILDATSVEILISLGLGEEIGVLSAQRRLLSASAYAYEQITLEGIGGDGLEYPRMTAQRCSPWLLQMEPVAGAECFSMIHDASHRALWAGSSYFVNASGGRVLSLTYPVNGSAQFFMGFFNVYRKRFLQGILSRCFANPEQACLDEPAIEAYRSPLDGGTLLTALNPTDDPVPQVTWLVAPGAFVGGGWRMLRSDGQWEYCEPVRGSGVHWDSLLFPYSLAPLDAAFFLHSHEGLHAEMK